MSLDQLIEQGKIDAVVGKVSQGTPFYLISIKYSGWLSHTQEPQFKVCHFN
jgi:hypothetical protein